MQTNTKVKLALNIFTPILMIIAFSMLSQQAKSSISSISDIKSGVHYLELKTPVTGIPGNHIIYYFWYECPFCRKLNITDIIHKNQNATFDVRHSGKGRFLHDAKIYYALKLSGGNPLIKPDDTSSIDGIMSSQKVMNQISADENFRAEMGLASVPAMIVGGKYIINFQALSGDTNELSILIQYLVKKSQPMPSLFEPK
jgi:hypothetical protein